MKFLIFNVIVFCSLGYLLTSKPNENFNQWISNTKNKISNISKDEVISTFKKATKETKEIKEINTDIVKESSVAIKDNKNSQNPNIVREASLEIKDNKNSHNKNNNHQIRKIIKEILDEKKQTQFEDKKFPANKLKEDFNRKISDQNYKKEYEKQSPKINFMTLEERENALAELITDMELYHLNNLAN